MKFKKLVVGIFIGVSILALASCSTTKRRNMDTASADMNGVNGAQASGIGEGENYGGQNGSGSAGRLAKRTYYFAYDKSDIRDEDKPAILANADYLVAHPNSKIILEGHTDPRGSREYNVALGERRADSVYEMLKSRGVNPDQVRVVSYGAQRLAAPGHDESDYQLDRRAIIVLAQR